MYENIMQMLQQLFTGQGQKLPAGLAGKQPPGGMPSGISDKMYRLPPGTMPGGRASGNVPSFVDQIMSDTTPQWPGNNGQFRQFMLDQIPKTQPPSIGGGLPPYGTAPGSPETNFQSNDRTDSIPKSPFLPRISMPNRPRSDKGIGLGQPFTSSDPRTATPINRPGLGNRMRGL